MNSGIDSELRQRIEEWEAGNPPPNISLETLRANSELVMNIAGMELRRWPWDLPDGVLGFLVNAPLDSRLFDVREHLVVLRGKVEATDACG